MITHAITVELPDPLYERIVRRATGAKRSIEDELATVVSEALSLSLIHISEPTRPY